MAEQAIDLVRDVAHPSAFVCAALTDIPGASANTRRAAECERRVADAWTASSTEAEAPGRLR